jgi:hypothetical protein
MTAADDIFKSCIPCPDVFAGAFRCRFAVNLDEVGAGTASTSTEMLTSSSRRPTHPKDFETCVPPCSGSLNSSRLEGPPVIRPERISGGKTQSLIALGHIRESRLVNAIRWEDPSDSVYVRRVDRGECMHAGAEAWEPPHPMPLWADLAHGLGTGTGGDELVTDRQVDPETISIISGAQNAPAAAIAEDRW